MDLQVATWVNIVSWSLLLSVHYQNQGLQDYRRLLSY